VKRWLKLAYSWWRMLLSDPRRIPRFPAELAAFLADLRSFRAQAGRPAPKVELAPVLFQKKMASTFDAHYVYQAAWAIRRIAGLRAVEHVDLSSNIPYVAALSAVVPVRYCEFNPPKIQLPGLSSEQADITALPFPARSVASLSCLHVLEHIGLGRYGDPVNPAGLEIAVREIARVMAPGSALFLSLPVGRERVCFNMHRVSDPGLLPRVLGAGFRLREFSVITDDRRFLEDVSPQAYASQEYACGLYWFERGAEHA
jgi:hypothetical protein